MRTRALVDAMNIGVQDGGRFQIAGHDLYVESTDGGASWQPVPNDLPGLGLHAFAVDPADRNHVWTFAAGYGLLESPPGLAVPGGSGRGERIRTFDLLTPISDQVCSARSIRAQNSSAGVRR
jgi:hypothetical protein